MPPECHRPAAPGLGGAPRLSRLGPLPLKLPLPPPRLPPPLSLSDTIGKR